jgi:uncharacterized membrane protein YbhN (UPF0104 family)
MIVSRIAVTARWYILLRSGGLSISFKKTLEITLAGLFASNFLPTTIGGDVVRLAGAIQLNLDAAISAASLIADRLIGLAGMAMAVPLAIPSIIRYSASLSGAPAHTTSQLFSIATISTKKWWHKAWVKGVDIFQRLISALSIWLKQPGALAKSFIFTWLHMLCLFSILTLLFVGMGEDITIIEVGGLYSIVYLVTLLPISINGYGLQEISMTYVFSELAGVSLTSAVTAALLFRTLFMLTSLPGAIYLPGILTKTDKKK